MKFLGSDSILGVINNPLAMHYCIALEHAKSKDLVFRDL